jgi:hypothetical protein
MIVGGDGVFVSSGSTRRAGVAVQRGLTEAHAGSELTALAPIMAVEGRTMDEDSHQLLMQLLQKSITLADALDAIIRRRSGIAETAPPAD